MYHHFFQMATPTPPTLPYQRIRVQLSLEKLLIMEVLASPISEIPRKSKPNRLTEF
ncbi:hypothetical protein GIB67_027978, partial [Kingdonia uniflora]